MFWVHVLPVVLGRACRYLLGVSRHTRGVRLVKSDFGSGEGDPMLPAFEYTGVAVAFGGCWGRGGFVFTGDAPFVSFTRPDAYRRWVLLADSPGDLLVDRHFSFSHRVANSYISIIATILVEQCLAVIPQTCYCAKNLVTSHRVV